MNPNTESNLKEKMAEMDSLHSKIMQTRIEITKEFSLITCTGKPIGLEALKRMERDGQFDHNLAHIQQYIAQNEEKLGKKQPDLFKKLNEIADYMKEEDYSKEFSSAEERVKKGQLKVDLDL